MNNKQDQLYKNELILTGILYIIATAAGILSVSIALPIISATDIINQIANNQSTLLVSGLLELIMAIAIAGIPVTLFNILKKDNELVAVGYLVARILEVIPIIAGAVLIFMLTSFSHPANNPASGALKDISILLVRAHDWTDLVGTQLIFSLTALVLNTSLFKTGIVPRFLSGWGWIGAILILSAGLLSLFGVTDSFSSLSVILYGPIALQEMVFAVWLIVKGIKMPNNHPRGK